MEFLVTMSTHVPTGTSEHEIADIQAREAARTSQLARDGRVLRLWRPPLRPGEWRTIGLFDANDTADLEQILKSMPLRVWRTDEVTALGSHPNDPSTHCALERGDAEFLTTMVITIPPGTNTATIDEVSTREAERTRTLARQGTLIRRWTLPGNGRNLGHWQAQDGNAMHAILQTLPMIAWLSIDTIALSRHPSDPATSPATTLE
jgi:muconolactone delta-isomerase